MKNKKINLPDSPEKLKQIILEMQRQHDKDIRILEERVRYLYHKLFGKKSEKSSGPSPQLPLFDLPEPDPDTAKPPKEKESEVKGHKRSRSGRKPLPAELPRVEQIHDIPEEEKVCSCGAELSCIGEEVSEKLDIIPASIRVVRHIRPKYACRCCEGVEGKGKTVKIAPVSPQMVAKGIASGGLLAHILTAKFADALPFYRQEQQFKRLGVDLNRNVMSSWAIKVSQKCKPLQELLQQEVLSGPLVNVDETTVQVLHEPGRTATTKSYMWIFRGGNTKRPSLLYHYAPTRSANVAEDFFKEYSGAVQSDGYSGYNFLDDKQEITHLGCLAHARRKFFDADKARGKKAGKPGSTTVALNFIRDLYALEKEFSRNGLSGEDLVAARHEKSKKLLGKFRKWLLEKERQVLTKGLLGKAISYTLSQWHRLEQFINCAEATPDNNLAENAIRPFVIGRKNWLFAGTVDGARASATIYSLIETAKACKLEPYAYLRYLFEKLPFAETEDDYRQLLPSNLSPEKLDYIGRWSVV